MTTALDFEGFPAEAFTFLRNLGDNNTREWFEEHKDTYQTTIVEPSKAFILALGDRLKTLSPNVRYDTATNGSGSMFRIYRDVRFSKDKTPYKTQLGMVFWIGPGKKTEHPGYYFQISPEGGFTGGGSYFMPKEMLAAYQQAVDADATGEPLAEAVAQIRAQAGFTVTGEQYKRVPRGYNKDHPRAELLRHKGLHANAPNIAAADLHGPAATDRVFETLKIVAPLVNWFAELDEKVLRT
ncbi:MAG: DUF2461 domain-containing protein [Chloroflexi bacterium]|nr:DUF2461 domain-containing protein [Chloroflexota bacterium]